MERKSEITRENSGGIEMESLANSDTHPAII